MRLLLLGIFAIRLDFWIGSTLDKLVQTVQCSNVWSQRLDVGLVIVHSKWLPNGSCYPVGRIPLLCNLLWFGWRRLSWVHSLLGGRRSYTPLPHWVFGPCRHTSSAFSSKKASKSSKQGSQSLRRSRSHSTGSVIYVCLCAGSGWLFPALRRLADYIALSGSPCRNQCVWDRKLDGNVLRKVSSTIASL